MRNSVSSLRGLFPHPGVVYPILPTGGMRIPRPAPGLASSGNDGNASEEGTRTLGETRRVGFVVQVMTGVAGGRWGAGRRATGKMMTTKTLVLSSFFARVVVDIVALWRQGVTTVGRHATASHGTFVVLSPRICGHCLTESPMRFSVAVVAARSR